MTQWKMQLNRSAAFKLLLIPVAAVSLLFTNNVVYGFGNHTTDLGMFNNLSTGLGKFSNYSTDLGIFRNNSAEPSQQSNSAMLRVKRRTQPQQGFFFPIAMYTVRHHRPAADRGRNVRPETWEYRGQYFYGYKPRADNGRRQAARLLAAGLPLLLAPLLSIIFSFPVLVPVAQTTTVTNGINTLGAPFRPTNWNGKRRRRRRRVGPPSSQGPRQQPNRDKSSRMKELEVVANYLHQVDYDEKQQSRVMVNYLQCNGLLSTEDHCLERLSCEFGDPANLNAPELERTVTSILLGHMLNNEFIPRPFIKRLKSAAVYGRNNSGKCSKYFCHYVDNNWDYTSMYPKGDVKVPFSPQNSVNHQKHIRLVPRPG